MPDAGYSEKPTPILLLPWFAGPSFIEATDPSVAHTRLEGYFDSPALFLWVWRSAA